MLEPISSKQRGSLQHLPGRYGNNAAILEDKRPTLWPGVSNSYTWNTLTAKSHYGCSGGLNLCCHGKVRPNEGWTQIENIPRFQRAIQDVGGVWEKLRWTPTKLQGQLRLTGAPFFPYIVFWFHGGTSPREPASLYAL